MKYIKGILKNWVYFYLLPLCLFIVFKNPIECLINQIFIKYLFSNLSQSSPILDFSILVIAVISIYPITKKIHKNAFLPRYYIFSYLAVFSIYLYYRFENQIYSFTSTILPSIKLLDIVFFIPFIPLIFYIIKQSISKIITNSQEKIDKKYCFTVEEPFTITSENDSFNRLAFIEAITNQIINTKPENSAFSIGISAKWGNGKTSFLYSIKEQLKNDSNILLIDLNVWKLNNSIQFIDNFLKSLKDVLSPYSLTVNNLIKDYAVILSKGAKYADIDLTGSLTHIFDRSENAESQFNLINSEIKKIDKKVVVFIDDIDRLDKQEIFEVIKLIRNSANFSNTFFVTAYDRNYILNAISDINSYNTNTFLEKIFQLEFAIPPIPFNKIQKELERELKLLIKESHFKDYKKIQHKGILHVDYGVSDLTSYFIKNMRDVVRFVNSLKLNYKFIQNDIYFIDFYSIELIRFKYPDLFLEIYNRTNDFFTTESENSTNVYSVNKLTYTLKSMNKESTNKNHSYFKKYKNTELYRFLSNEETKNEYKLKELDIFLITKSYYSIFYRYSRGEREDDFNSNLSITYPSMYDRYFILSINGRLSEIEFSKLREQEFESQIKTINKFIEKDNLTQDLLEKYELIKDYDNRIDFEKIIKSIFYIANIEINPTATYKFDRIVGFDGRKLSNLLNWTKVSMFYKDKNEYKAFLLSFLNTDSLDYSFNNQYLYGVLKSKYFLIGDIFESKELTEITLTNFNNALKKSSEFTKELYWFYTNCKDRIETPYSSGGIGISYKINRIARNSMKRFVLLKCLDSYLNFIIRFDESGENYLYYPNWEIINDIFESTDKFIKLLEKCKLNSFCKEEFIKLYYYIKENNTGVELNWFEKIKPRIVLY